MSRTRWLSFTSSEDLLAQARLEDNGEAGVAVEGVYGIWVWRRQLEVEGDSISQGGGPCISQQKLFTWNGTIKETFLESREPSKNEYSYNEHSVPPARLRAPALGSLEAYRSPTSATPLLKLFCSIHFSVSPRLVFLYKSRPLFPRAYTRESWPKAPGNCSS